jgi:hypothetical protein
VLLSGELFSLKTIPMQKHLATFLREGDGGSGKQDGRAARVRNSALGGRGEFIADAAGKSSAGGNEGVAAPGTEPPERAGGRQDVQQPRQARDDAGAAGLVEKVRKGRCTRRFST